MCYNIIKIRDRKTLKNKKLKMEGLDLMMKWFKEARSLEDVKKVFRNLIKQYHPDTHEASQFDYYNSIMSEINTEYEEAFNRFKDIHTTADGKTYTKATTETPEEFRAIIESLIHASGLEINLIGCYIWVTGNSFEHKSLLKSLNFKWASRKRAWFFVREQDAVKSRKSLTLDEIKSKYGCETYKAEGYKAIA